MTSPELARKLTRNIELARYLEQLSALANRPVASTELTTTSQLDELASLKKQHARNYESVGINLRPDATQTRKFQTFIERLAACRSSEVWIWVKRTNSCGTLILPSLLDVHFNFFDLSFDENGVCEVATTDGKNLLFLDIDESGLNMEIQGQEWATVQY